MVAELGRGLIDEEVLVRSEVSWNAKYVNWKV